MITIYRLKRHILTILKIDILGGVQFERFPVRNRKKWSTEYPSFCYFSKPVNFFCWTDMKLLIFVSEGICRTVKLLLLNLALSKRELCIVFKVSQKNVNKYLCSHIRPAAGLQWCVYITKALPHKYYSIKSQTEPFNHWPDPSTIIGVKTQRNLMLVKCMLHIDMRWPNVIPCNSRIFSLWQKKKIENLKHHKHIFIYCNLSLFISN